MKDAHTRRSRGFGFVTFTDMESASRVLSEAEHIIDARKVEAKPAVPKSEVVREPPSEETKQTAEAKSTAEPGGAGGPRTNTNKIFVGGLHYDTTSAGLGEYFGQFGEVLSSEVMYNRDTGKSRGFGFIVFAMSDEGSKAASQAIEKPSHIIDGKLVEVKAAVPKHLSTSGRGGPDGHDGKNKGGATPRSNNAPSPGSAVPPTPVGTPSSYAAALRFGRGATNAAVGAMPGELESPPGRPMGEMDGVVWMPPGGSEDPEAIRAAMMGMADMTLTEQAARQHAAFQAGMSKGFTLANDGPTGPPQGAPEMARIAPNSQAAYLRAAAAAAAAGQEQAAVVIQQKQIQQQNQLLAQQQQLHQLQMQIQQMQALQQNLQRASLAAMLQGNGQSVPDPAAVAAGGAVYPPMNAAGGAGVPAQLGALQNAGGPPMMSSQGMNAGVVPGQAPASLSLQGGTGSAGLFQEQEAPQLNSQSSMDSGISAGSPSVQASNLFEVPTSLASQEASADRALGATAANAVNGLGLGLAGDAMALGSSVDDVSGNGGNSGSAWLAPNGLGLDLRNSEGELLPSTSLGGQSFGSEGEAGLYNLSPFSMLDSRNSSGQPS
mmetsp:Transcript_6694/g.19169  ORF Transcript_6694/g.19169 Transcript_6694/m.19169 type:complete len:603 (+) Transcript_6694:223-2031(+)